MSAASNLPESMDCISRHESMPVLMYLAIAVKNTKEKVCMKYGYVWNSKQRLPASSLSAEETLKAVLALDQQRKLLPGRDRSSIRRGDSPMTDSIIDDFLSILRKESTDLVLLNQPVVRFQALRLL